MSTLLPICQSCSNFSPAIDKWMKYAILSNVYLLSMDILAYFKLSEHPFRIGPDPRYLYFSDQVKESIAKCEFMAQERIGPIYLYGPIGSGKTSIMRRLYERLT